MPASCATHIGRNEADEAMVIATLVPAPALEAAPLLGLAGAAALAALGLADAPATPALDAGALGLAAATADAAELAGAAPLLGAGPAPPQALNSVAPSATPINMRCFTIRSLPSIVAGILSPHVRSCTLAAMHSSRWRSAAIALAASFAAIGAAACGGAAPAPSSLPVVHIAVN